jgi:hypothetical protein
LATYTVSTSSGIWAKSLIALNENAEANESREFYNVEDQDVIEAISFSLDMWLDGDITATNKELVQFAGRLRRFADKIERRAHGDGAKCDGGVQGAMAGETNESAQNGTNFR